MRRLVPLLFALLAPLSAAAQGPGMQAPIMLDLKKVPIGAWSEYKLVLNQQMEMTSRWALIARDEQSTTIENRMEGGPIAMMGGKMLVKMRLAPDPTMVDQPVKQLIMQMGPNDPFEMPLNAPGMQNQKFNKPDPKKLVGKEAITVGGKKVPTSHYRDQNEMMTFDTWVSETTYPLGIVKMASTPKPGAVGPGGQPLPSITMELTAQGKGATSELTKPPKPMDPAMLQQMMGGRPPGAAAPGGPAHKPGAAPSKAPAASSKPATPSTSKPADKAAAPAPGTPGAGKPAAPSTPPTGPR